MTMTPLKFRRPVPFLLCQIWAVLLSLACASWALAQTAAPGEEPPPPPVQLQGDELLTKDGVMLTATYYEGMKGKESVPVILLHASGGDCKEYATLAAYLQKEKGCAVLVPDLRGHGSSTQVRVGSGIQELSERRLSPAQYGRMVQFDMETLKKFLLKENDKEKLNVQKLCIVGAELGCAVALNWARLDWSWPDYQGLKQGKDVRALVLLSPEWNVSGLDVKGAVAHPAVSRGLSIMIIVGKQDRRGSADARRMFQAFERYHPEPPEGQSEKKDLYFGQLDTKLQGTKMLAVESLNIDRAIGLFIDRRLVNQSFPWQKRGK